MALKKRPTQAQPGDKPLPTKFRALQSGVLVFQPTAGDRVKLAMGYAVRVRVAQNFQHNPGKIEVNADWDVIPDQPDKTMPRIAPIDAAAAPEEKGGKNNA